MGAEEMVSYHTGKIFDLGILAIFLRRSAFTPAIRKYIIEEESDCDEEEIEDIKAEDIREAIEDLVFTILDEERAYLAVAYEILPPNARGYLHSSFPDASDYEGSFYKRYEQNIYRNAFTSAEWIDQQYITSVTWDDFCKNGLKSADKIRTVEIFILW